MIEKQIEKWFADLFLNDDDDEFTEEVTPVAVPDSGVSENVPQLFLCSQSHFMVLKMAQEKRRHHATFWLSCIP